MTRVLILANGPGELWDWARPMIRELKSRSMEVSLLLLPCQFASGEESRVAKGLGADEIAGPYSLAGTFRAARAEGRRSGAVLQLGGDLLWGRLAAKAGRAPLICYAYGKKKGLSRCDGVFTAFPAMAEAMAGRAEVAGDLVRDSLEMDLQGEGEAGQPGAPAVLFFPGSRAAIREFALPFLRDMASVLKGLLPLWELRLALSPFVPAGEEAKWLEGGFTVARGPGAYDGVAFAVTQPGTNTLELMYRGVPFSVLVPFASLRQVPLPGVAGMAASLPFIGPRLKSLALKKKGERAGLLAWPNRMAGRELAQEIKGDFSPPSAAERLALWLRDEPRRGALSAALKEVAGLSPLGAARRIADEIERMAGHR